MRLQCGCGFIREKSMALRQSSLHWVVGVVLHFVRVCVHSACMLCVCAVIAVGPPQAKYAEMVSKLPEDAPCFVVFDFHDSTPDGRVVKKLVLIKWCVPPYAHPPSHPSPVPFPTPQPPPLHTHTLALPACPVLCDPPPLRYSAGLVLDVKDGGPCFAYALVIPARPHSPDSLLQVPRHCALPREARDWRHVPDPEGEADGPGR